MLVVAVCPNECSGRGVCVTGSPQSCECFPGFIGVDCSLRVCPAGKAWYDFPTSEFSAHADYTECSNMGLCNRQTGLCVCREGFSGPACDQMLCPLGQAPPSAYDSGEYVMLPCSGNGRCLSLRQAASYQDYIHYFDSIEYSNWDADMIYGCVCDSEWEGFDCSKRSCPKGDDPMTAGVDEVQLIDCTCETCAGGLYITFKNQKTRLIPYNATAAVVEHRLKQLSIIESVTVTNVVGTYLCSSSGSVTEITFLLPQGNQPAMTISTTSTLSATISVRTDGQRSSVDSSYRSVAGTREYVECSNHGVCLNATGLCKCFDAFSSSNGFGDSGTRGDCGYQQFSEVTYTVGDISTATACALVDDAVCSGHGMCTESTATCTCDSGYSGAACSNITCPYSLTWFGDVGTNHSSLSECGGVGECDGTTGVCFNCGGNWGYFNGSGCEYISCAINDEDATCSGHGVCLTMKETGLLNYDSYKNPEPIAYSSWDADAVRGCLCERAISIDNQYPTSGYSFLDYYSYIEFNGSAPYNNYTVYYDTYLTRYYRGPYAYTATDYKGYDCSHVGCPTGDNPVTTAQYNEIQAIQFFDSFSSDYFTLTFRGNTTYPIYCNQTIEVLQYRLENLYTISSVTVTRTGNESSSLCDSTSDARIYVEFLTEFGDLPLMTASSYQMNITEYQKCTKEDLECSAQGICNESTGVCSCRSGYGSSNGTSCQVGERGDCTFVNKFYTVLYDGSSQTEEVVAKAAPKSAGVSNQRIRTVLRV